MDDVGRLLRALCRWAATMVVVAIGVIGAGAAAQAAGDDTGAGAWQPGHVESAAPTDSDEPEPESPDDPSSDASDNEFWPEGRDLDECISALPRPGCGSDAKGGWRQAMIFGVVVVALGFIAWRLVMLVRRRDHPPAEADDDHAGGRGERDEDADTTSERAGTTDSSREPGDTAPRSGV